MTKRELLSSAPPRFWREREFWLLAGLVVLMYGVRLTDLSLRGEESRRGLVAIEMLATGDWIVPRQQGDPFFMSCRPPLQSWLIALAGLARGEVDAFAIRLPSALALLGVALLVYAYTRQFVSRLGAVAAGGACVTFAQVMELGRLGETDALFTLFVSASLLIWHAGYLRGWPAGAMWSAGYLFAALATLTKGLQGPVYFVGPVMSYLVLRREWRALVSRAHVVGVVVYLVVVGSWQVPYFLQLGWAGVRHAYFGDVRSYLHDWRWTVIAEHLLAYPATILLGCLGPWSLLLIGYARRDFRAALGVSRAPCTFFALALAVTFPTVWFAMTSLPRFYMPMYPGVAVLVGIAAERSIWAGRAVEYHRLWKFFAAAMGLSMVLAGLALPVAVQMGGQSWNSGQPLWFAGLFGALSLGLARVCWRSRVPQTEGQAIRGALAIAGFLGLASTGLYVNQRAATSLPAADQMARLRSEIPADAPLVSLGPVNHLFNCLYGRPIRALPAPGTQAAEFPGFDYFCVMAQGWNSPVLPFPWEPVGEVVCDRYWMPVPEQRVIVGRRRDEPLATNEQPSPIRLVSAEEPAREQTSERKAPGRAR